MSKYLSVAETAKLVRKALKESFPGVKFSVRSSSYSGGASIDIRYTDGPVEADVKRVADAFSGAYFDGMIDYKGSVYHELDGEKVRFGADFIFVNREYSDEAVGRAIQAVKAKYAGNLKKYHPEVELTVEGFRKGSYYNLDLYSEGPGYHEDSLSATIHHELARRTRVIGQPSAMLRRVVRTGDDGYGRGTTGIDGKGGEKGYPCH